jgi:hypothetical protein
MNAAFFGLAVLAALNPKLLGVDLLLIENAPAELTDRRASHQTSMPAGRHPFRVRAAPGPAHPEGTMRRWTLPAMVSL